VNLKDHIRHVPDFPKPGILFYDISTLLAHAEAWKEAMRQVEEAVKPLKPDLLVGIDARGFLIAAPLALALGIGFVMVRKKNKLPGAVVRHSYDLEYGSDTIEIQEGAVQPGQRVVILDDLLATGGTMTAAVDLCRKVGAEVVGTNYLIELSFLNGRQRLADKGVGVHSLMIYDN